MMQKIIIFLVVFLAVIFQVAVLPNFFPGSIVPDAVLLLVIIWTRRDGFEAALPRTLLGGLLSDIACSWPIGANVISLVIISFAISFISKRFLAMNQVWKGFLMVVFIIVATVVNILILDSILKLFSHIKKEEVEYLMISVSSVDIVIKIIFNLMLMLVIYPPLKKMETIMEFYTARTVNQRRSFQRR